MKFTIPKKQFADCLTALSRVVERRNTYPILANVLIIAEQDSLRLRATDLDIEISQEIEAAVETTGTCTAEARLLADIVRKLPDGDVTFEHDTTKMAAVIKAGRSRFNLATLSPDQFPDLKSGQFTNRFTIAAKDLLGILNKVSFAISTEETRYYLNGVYLHAASSDAGQPVLRAVATDGHRMARCEIAIPDGAAGIPGVIVPRKTVGEFARLLDDATDEVAVEVSDSKIRVTSGSTVLLSKLIEGTFPDYQRVTPKLSNTVAIVDAKELSRALERVSIMGTDKGGKAVKLKFEDNLLELNVSNPDHGSSDEDMAATWDNSALEIGFNARYLQDVLGNLSGKTVSLSLQDAGSPARISSDDDPGSLFVLMPMRV